MLFTFGTKPYTLRKPTEDEKSRITEAKQVATKGAVMTFLADVNGKDHKVDFNPLYLRDALATFKGQKSLELGFLETEHGPLMIRVGKELSLTLPQVEPKK